jgi:lysozyme family protein
MANDLDEALEYLLEEEGGWSNHPSDRGGKTMYGVTQHTYDGWRTKKRRAKQTVRNLDKTEAREIYRELYWLSSGCDKLPWPISYLTFDAAVNSGPSRAVAWTQSGLGVKTDGKVGPTTLAVAQRAVDEGNGSALLAIVDARLVFLSRLIQRDKSQTDFLLGWWRRTQRVLARALLSNPEGGA